MCEDMHMHIQMYMRPLVIYMRPLVIQTFQNHLQKYSLTVFI